MFSRALAVVVCAVALVACGDVADDEPTAPTRPAQAFEFECHGTYGVYIGPTGMVVVPNHTEC